MQNPNREEVAVALFTLLQTVPGFVTYSRRPQEWDDSVNMPALYMGNTAETYEYQHGTATPPHITLAFDIFVYIKVGLDPNSIPDTQLNQLIDAIETKLGGFAVNGQAQTLGGIVDHAWIDGDVHRFPGYLNGQGGALFQIKTLVPS
jgi:hypothetical protein